MPAIESTLARFAAEGQRDLLATVELLAGRGSGEAATVPLAELATELEAQHPESDPDSVARELLDAEIAVRGPGGLRLAEGAAAAAEEALLRLAAGRAIAWTRGTTTQGEILTAFAAHCRDELDDVVVLAERRADGQTAALELGWRRERCRIELRHGFLALRPLGGLPALLVGDTSSLAASFFRAFALDAELRTGVGLLDLAGLDKASAVRSTPFVYLEWFLRDAYGVKLAPSAPFTRALIDTGVLHLGFG